MPDLLEGRITLQGYLAKLRGFWWHRVRVDGRPRGLYNLLRQAEFDAALERFEAAYAEDPIGGCRGLYPRPARAGRRARPASRVWSRCPPTTSVRRRRCCACSREARFIHALRDGRDSAASVTGKTWGPRRVGAAIGWWAERLRRSRGRPRATRTARRTRIPAESFRVVLLEDLVGHERDADGYASLLALPRTRGRARQESPSSTPSRPPRPPTGRWRQQLGAPAGSIPRRYEWTVAALEREGNHAAPGLRAALDREAAGVAGVSPGRPGRLAADPVRDEQRDRPRAPEPGDGDRTPAAAGDRPPSSRFRGGAAGRRGTATTSITSPPTGGRPRAPTGLEPPAGAGVSGRLRRRRPDLVVFDGVHPYRALTHLLSARGAPARSGAGGRCGAPETPARRR